MRQKFAPLQSRLAPFDGLDKTVFFLKVTCHNILHGLIEVPALLGRSLRQAGFQVGVEMNFHALRLLENRPLGKVAGSTLMVILKT
jgi:hypothetical protein